MKMNKMKTMMTRPQARTLIAVVSVTAIALTAGCADSAGVASAPSIVGGGEGGGGMVPVPSPSQGSAGLSQPGAQDFGAFRQVISDGVIPHPSLLDAMGFFAEHKFEYPDADCGQDICLHAPAGSMSNLMNGAPCTVIQIGLNTPVDVDTLPTRPMDLFISVDVSGSMSGTPMTSLQDGLRLMLDALGPDDRVTLIAYSHIAEVVAADVPADDTDTLMAAIASLNAQGKTNLYDGLFTAMELAQAAESSDRERRVLFLSDGAATAGLQVTEPFVTLAKSAATQAIGLTTIGIGEGFDAELMKAIAEAGAGNFYFLENPAAVTEVFTTEVQTSLWPLATDVTIDLEVAEGYRIGRVEGARDWQGGPWGGKLQIPTLFLASRETAEIDPEAGAGESRRGGGGAIIAELIGDPTAANPPSRSVGTLTLTYTDPQTGETMTQVRPVESPIDPDMVPIGGWFDLATVEKGFIALNILTGLRLACELAQDLDFASGAAMLENLSLGVHGWLTEQEGAGGDGGDGGTGNDDIVDDLIWVDALAALLRDAESGQPIVPQPQPVDPWPHD